MAGTRETTTPQGYVEEYKELRSEIRLFLERRSKDFQFALVLTAAVMAIPVDLRTPLLFYVAAALVSFLWYDRIRRIRAIFRIAAYLEVFVESHVEGLNWETRAAGHDIQTSFVGRMIANGIFPSAFLVHVGSGFYLSTWSRQYDIALLLFAALILSSLTLQSYRTATHGRIEPPISLDSDLGLM